MDGITRSALLLTLLAALVPMTSSPGTRAHPTQWQVPASAASPLHASPTLAEELEACDTCEAVPSSGSTSSRRSGAMWLDLPRGEAGEYHRVVVSSDS